MVTLPQNASQCQLLSYRQLQDELERADHTMPQWWLKMQAQAQHHGSGQKNSAEQVADNTGAHDRCSTQHSSVLLGGTCAQLRESASEEAGVSHTLVDDAAAGVGLVPEALDKGSGNVFTLDDRQQAVCQDHQLDAEDWQLEAQASVQKLTRKYVVSYHALPSRTCMHCCQVIPHACFICKVDAGMSWRAEQFVSRYTMQWCRCMKISCMQ